MKGYPFSMKLLYSIVSVGNFPTWYHLGFFWNVGFVLFVFMILQMMTGIFMAMFYNPSLEGALDSMIYVMKEVKWGFMLHHMHGVGASFVFGLMYFHMCKALVCQLECNVSVWLSGFVMMVFMVVEGFLGYSMVLGSMSYWAIKVVVSMFTVLGGFGDVIVGVILGGDSISDFTVSKFYVLHCVIPFFILFLILLHMWALHLGGSSMYFSFKGALGFYPYMFYKDLLLFFFIFYIYMSCVLLFPNFFYNPVNFEIFNPYITPEHIEPEWYLSPFFVILKGFDSKMFGIIIVIMVFFGFVSSCLLGDKSWTLGGVSSNYSSFMVLGYFLCYWLVLESCNVYLLHPINSMVLVLFFNKFSDVFSFFYFEGLLFSFVVVVKSFLDEIFMALSDYMYVAGEFVLSFFGGFVYFLFFSYNFLVLFFCLCAHYLSMFYVFILDNCSSFLFSTYCLVFCLFSFLLSLIYFGDFALVCFFSMLLLISQTFVFVYGGWSTLDFKAGMDYKTLNLGLSLFFAFDMLMMVALIFYLAFLFFVPVYFAGGGLHQFVSNFLLFMGGKGLLVIILGFMGCFFMVLGSYISSEHKWCFITFLIVVIFFFMVFFIILWLF